MLLLNTTNKLVLLNYSTRQLLCHSNVAGKRVFKIYFLFLQNILLMASLNTGSPHVSARCIQLMAVIRRVGKTRIFFEYFHVYSSI